MGIDTTQSVNRKSITILVMNNYTYTALITPFINNKLDEKALEKIIEFQIDGNIDGIVVCGTTGESPTLSHQEHNLVIKLAVEIANKRIKIMAGTGSNSTHEAIALTEYAKKIGADSCLVVTPYYNKPSPQGVYQHFKEIAAVGLPVILYNIPGRSVINMKDIEIANLANISNIIGIKDATGDLARVATLRKLITKDFLYLSGEDMTAVGFNAMGGNGIISVTSNIVPNLVSNLQKLCAIGKYDEALKLQDQLTNLHQALFMETNPIPVKYAASLLDICSEEARLPLCSPNQETKDQIAKQLKLLNLI